MLGTKPGNGTDIGPVLMELIQPEKTSTSVYKTETNLLGPARNNLSLFHFSVLLQVPKEF